MKTLMPAVLMQLRTTQLVQVAEAKQLINIALLCLLSSVTPCIEMMAYLPIFLSITQYRQVGRVRLIHLMILLRGGGPLLLVLFRQVRMQVTNMTLRRLWLLTTTLIHRIRPQMKRGKRGLENA